MSNGEHVAYIGRKAAELRDCVCEALDPTPCRCTRVAGAAPAWDNCCADGCEGQAWVAVTRVHPTATPGGGAPFPQQATGRFRCGVNLLAVELQVGVLRCSQALTQDGKPPSPERLEQEAEQVLLDQEAVFGAIICCFIPEHYGTDQPWTLGAWEPQGPNGGCVGGRTTLTIGVGGCPDC